MSSLAYLAGIPVTRVKGVSPKRAEALQEVGVESVADLLLHVPRRYVDRSRMSPISDLRPGQEATVLATVASMSARRPGRGRTMVVAEVSDGTGRLRVTWFNQPYRERQLPVGTEVALFGRIEEFRGRRGLTNPVTEILRGELMRTARLVPIYPSVAAIPSWRFLGWMENALERSRPISDPLPDTLRRRLGLLERDGAFARIHRPDSLEQVAAARRRLVFDELFRLELALALRKRRQMEEARGITHVVEGELVDRFLAGLPFRPTGAQERVLGEIRADLTAAHPMHRLLQGEVGSGKTVVALASLIIGIQGGFQGAVMAPTEVLAEQHFLGMGALLEETGLAPVPSGPGLRMRMDSLFDGGGPAVRMALLTSSRVSTNVAADASREEVLGWIATGEIDLVVGTHALIQEGVHFRRLGVAVVDEQHRFGVAQRVMLREKGAEADPDLLIMTATPIPRTLAMTLYGDLDVSVLDEMPPGRSPVETRALGKSDAEQEEAYAVVRAAAAEGRQVFVVCPLVEDSPKVEAASATAEFERLGRVFPELRLGLLHGQLPSREKGAVMASFRRGDIDVLVATTVIEVGIDVPNATVMLIEDAERFGLSQLHQLRGRVGRGSHGGTCLLVAEPATDDGRARLDAMVATSDGFALAEEDLRIRGQGTVFGTRQSGVADLRLADLLTDFDILVDARREAFSLVTGDPELGDHPDLREEVQGLLGDAVDWLFVS